MGCATTSAASWLYSIPRRGREALASGGPQAAWALSVASIRSRSLARILCFLL